MLFEGRPSRQRGRQTAEEKQLDRLMQAGYELLENRRTSKDQVQAACDKWLDAWEQVKQMATPDMRTIDAFDYAYPNLTQFASNWTGDLEMELGNANYHEQRIRYVHEYLDLFPDEDDDIYVLFKRAEGEALWRSGRQAEAESMYAALVEKLPDKAWAYIGWSDEYYIGAWTAKDYASGEAILLRALERPTLEERQDVLERLVRLYIEWGRPDQGAPFLAEMEEIQAREKAEFQAAIAKVAPPRQEYTPPPPPPQPPSRNKPCWCGSGKKYKFCHMRSDRQKGGSTP